MPYISIPYPKNNKIDEYYQVIEEACIGRLCFDLAERKPKSMLILGRAYHFPLKVCGTMWDKGCPVTDKELREHINVRKERENKGWKYTEI